jgi:hypothetical protein
MGMMTERELSKFLVDTTDILSKVLVDTDFSALKVPAMYGWSQPNRNILSR